MASKEPPPMDETFDQTIDLVRRAQGGNSEALESLFTRYYERVRRMVRLRLGSALRNRMDSGDILQETFLEALRTFDRFEMRDQGSFINWLARLAENRIRDAADYHHALKRDAGREVPLSPGDRSTELDLGLKAGGLLPSEGADEAEQVARLEAAIERLPDADRELILLRNYAGAAWDTVASLTGRPSPDAARVAHKQVIVRLSHLMDGG
jgi:RNA polymerase sigma-70 factor, ECF subfamily